MISPAGRPSIQTISPTHAAAWTPASHCKRYALALALCGAMGGSAALGEETPGLPDRLIQAGVTPSLTYNGEIAANLAGGVKRGEVYAGNLHMRLAFNGERLVETPGLSGFLDVMWISGGRPEDYAGAAQGVSNFADLPALRLYEAWLEYNFGDNRFSILGGRYDLNTEFYYLASAAMLLNPSFGIGPEFGLSGFSGPSIFPNTSLAVRLAYKPTPNIMLQTAVLDGAPVDRVNGSPAPLDPHNGVLLVAEAAYLTYSSGGGDPGDDPGHLVGRAASQAPYDDKFAVGAWYYTARLSQNATPLIQGEGQVQGEGGGYAIFDHLLFQSKGDPKRRLSGFLQLGFANRTVNRFGTYLGAGLVASGILASRTDDQFGLAVAMASNGSRYTAAQQQAGVPVNATETALEISYLAQLTSWIGVQPDVQYVIHPNTDPNVANATIVQIRAQVMF
jgi:porin